MNPEEHKILLVDDDAFQLELVASQLADIGWLHVICASNGAQALARFDEHGASIAAIISDLSMPDMDGLVLMRHLNQRGFGGGIILLSGVQADILSSAGELVQAHGLNILGCLHKPCNLDRLQQFLERLRAPEVVVLTPQDALLLGAERLQAALAAGEFVPWYQPKVAIHSGATLGVEALARWPQADGSLIGPGVFVPAMEAAGLADALFFAMARQVASDMEQWRSKGIHVKASINMSMETAHNLAMPEQLGHIVDSAGISPEDFVIEVTESRLMVNRALTLESLTRLSLMGFTLSIDDFGTGFSSLMQLIDLPFRELKIDGSFVQRAGHEPKAQTVVDLSIVLGMTLKMDVVAEGVETAEQLEFLRNSGCALVQGFFVARPMPFTACTDWISLERGRVVKSTGVLDLPRRSPC
jgi:EAL domain-containing protein (putative c-di-GMP-specific phosphodiesterase class I)/DNA-binding NarL/FixJ family response regulator